MNLLLKIISNKNKKINIIKSNNKTYDNKYMENCNKNK